MVNDTVADFIIRIKNAAATQKAVELPLTKLNEHIAKLLEKLGYVSEVRVFKESKVSYKSLHVMPTSKLSGIRRISKSGLRVYKGYADLNPVLGGMGVAVLSTPKGILTDREARKLKIGGEVLFEVW
ncbi:MAG: 30S ribosomal protein S8 [candidate division WWE3 bacterium]|nr:30S ribosomal protein S8 [candidate division WWE3 bacterium]